MNHNLFAFNSCLWIRQKTINAFDRVNGILYYKNHFVYFVNDWYFSINNIICTVSTFFI